MIGGRSRSALCGFLTIAVVAGIISGCSERKPAGPPAGSENAAAPPAPSTDSSAETK